MKKWVSIFSVFIFFLSAATGFTAASESERSPIPFFVQLPEGDRWGYLDPDTLVWKIQPRYVRADRFTTTGDSLAWVKDSKGAFSLINPQGRTVTAPMMFDSVGAPSEGLARFKVDGRWGYLNIKDGSFQLSPIYLQAREFSEGLAAVEYKPGKWIYISPAGKKMTLREFSFAFSFQNKRAVAMEEGGFYGVIDTQGEWVLPPKFGAIFPPATGEKVFIAGKVDKTRYSFIPYYELVNSEGFALSPLKVNESKPFLDFPAPVRKDDLWGFVAPDGKLTISFQFENVQSFTQSHLSAAKQGGKWGVIALNKEEKDGFFWVVPPAWEEEPDLSSLQAFSPAELKEQGLLSPIEVGRFFYDSQGKELVSYPNFMAHGYRALRENRPTDALSFFQKALEKLPNDPAALYGIEQAKTKE